MPGFLLQYHRKSGEVHVEKFDSPKHAMQKRIALESTTTDDDVEIVVIAREVGDLCSYENVFSADGFLQTNALQRGATR